ncbi:unnamed protein product [Arctogadus glacialis]
MRLVFIRQSERPPRPASSSIVPAQIRRQARRLPMLGQLTQTSHSAAPESSCPRGQLPDRPPAASLRPKLPIAQPDQNQSPTGASSSEAQGTPSTTIGSLSMGRSSESNAGHRNAPERMARAVAPL